MPYREADGPTPITVRVRLAGPFGSIAALVFLFFATLWVWFFTSVAADPDRVSWEGIALTLGFAMSFVLLLVWVIKTGGSRYLVVASTLGGVLVGDRRIVLAPEDRILLSPIAPSGARGAYWEVGVDGRTEVLFESLTRDLSNEVAEAIATVAGVELVRRQP